MCLFKKKETIVIQRDVSSPSDIVPRDAICNIENSIVIDLCELSIPFTHPPKVWIPPIPNTDSMDPVMDCQHNNILIQGMDKENQRIMVNWIAEEWFSKQMGNVVVYQADMLIIHRLVKVEYDEDGRVFTFKGDNNTSDDPYRVRDDDIKYLSIGTIY